MSCVFTLYEPGVGLRNSAHSGHVRACSAAIAESPIVSVVRQRQCAMYPTEQNDVCPQETRIDEPSERRWAGEAHTRKER